MLNERSSEMQKVLAFQIKNEGRFVLETKPDVLTLFQRRLLALGEDGLAWETLVEAITNFGDYMRFEEGEVVEAANLLVYLQLAELVQVPASPERFINPIRRGEGIDTPRHGPAVCGQTGLSISHGFGLRPKGHSKGSLVCLDCDATFNDHGREGKLLCPFCGRGWFKERSE